MLSFRPYYKGRTQVVFWFAILSATCFGLPSAYAQSEKSPSSFAPQPAKLDLIPLQPPWTKVCQKDPNSTKEFCRVLRGFSQAQDQTPTVVLAFDTFSDDNKIQRSQMHVQLPQAVLLRPGFRMILEKGDPIEGRYDVCVGPYCLGTADVSAAELNILKKSRTVTIAVKNQITEVKFNLPMQDFVSALAGPATDPKKIEEQNQALQKQLEKRAQKQREMLEKEQQASPAPGLSKASK